MKPPPAKIDNAVVLLWASTADLLLTEACKFYEGFENGRRRQDNFPALAIARYADSDGCYLFLCDDQWETQNDTDHQSVDEARMFADSLYPGINERWQEAV